MKRVFVFTLIISILSAQIAPVYLPQAYASELDETLAEVQATQDVNEMDHLIQLDASFISSFNALNEEQRLTKILQTRREIRRVQELIEAHSDDIKSAERWFDISDDSFKATRGLAIVSLTILFLLTGSRPSGGNSGEFRILPVEGLLNYLAKLDFTLPHKALTAPSILAVIAFFIRWRAERELISKEDAKRELEVRLWELDDRLEIMEQMTRTTLSQKEFSRGASGK